MKTIASKKKLILVLLAGGVRLALPSVKATLKGDLPTLAPELALPLVINTSVLRIVSTWTCVQPEAACATGLVPTIEGRIQVLHG